MANYHEMYKMQQMSDPQKRLNNPLDVYFIYKDEDDEKNVYRQIDEGIRKVLEQKAKEAKEAKKKSENEKVAKERAAKLDAIKNRERKIPEIPATPTPTPAPAPAPVVSKPAPAPVVPEPPPPPASVEPPKPEPKFEIQEPIKIKQAQTLDKIQITPTDNKFTVFTVVAEPQNAVKPENVLPAGLNFNEDGTITGSTVKDGEYTIKIKVAKYENKDLKSDQIAELKIIVEKLDIQVKYAEIKGTVGKELEKTNKPTITPNDIDSNKITFIEKTEPPLPAGLKIDVKGVISGTPIEPTTNAEGNLSANDYIVKYSYLGIEGIATINIKVEPQEIILNYTIEKAQYEINKVIEINKPNITPANNEPSIYEYSINTPLPTGLTLNAETGVIEGKPTEKTDVIKEYTITATSNYKKTNEKPCIISIDVYPTPIIPELKYEGTFDNLKQGTNYTFGLSTEGQFNNFILDDNTLLPESLSLDPNNGQISGTVKEKLTTEEEKKNGKTFEVKVTADFKNNDYNKDEYKSKRQTTMQITVLKRDTLVFNYDEIKGQQGQPINASIKTITGKINDTEKLTFKFEDEANKPVANKPEEFTIEELTGEIKAAKPLTKILKPTDYTITVQDMFDNTFETTVKISVKPKEPIKFKYADIGGTVGQSEEINTSPTLDNNEGNIEDYYKNFNMFGFLPTELTLDAKTGLISGLPKEEFDNDVTITGTDLWGDKFDTTVKINISKPDEPVAPVAPVAVSIKPPRENFTYDVKNEYTQGETVNITVSDPNEGKNYRIRQEGEVTLVKSGDTQRREFSTDHLEDIPGLKLDEKTGAISGTITMEESFEPKATPYKIKVLRTIVKTNTDQEAIITFKINPMLQTTETSKKLKLQREEEEKKNQPKELNRLYNVDCTTMRNFLLALYEIKPKNPRELFTNSFNTIVNENFEKNILNIPEYNTTTMQDREKINELIENVKKQVKDFKQPALYNKFYKGRLTQDLLQLIRNQMNTFEKCWTSDALSQIKGGTRTNKTRRVKIQTIQKLTKRKRDKKKKRTFKSTFTKSATKPTFRKSATKHDKNIRKNTRKKHV